MKKVIKKLTVHYREQGTGDLVVLLHGWGGRNDVFARLINLLALKYHVVAPDLPGFGESQEPPEPWHVADYARWAAEFIASFGAEKVILLGHSFGGRVVIKLCSLPVRPFQLEKIILVDSAGIKPHHSLGYYFRVNLYKALRLFCPGFLVKRLRRLFGSPDYAAASEVMRKSLVYAVNEDLSCHLDCVKCPTLLVWGEHDRETPLSDAKFMESKIKDAGLVVLKEAGHYSFLEQEYHFNLVMRSFLEID